MEQKLDIHIAVAEKSKETLTNQLCSFGDESFILSESEAVAVGAAIIERNHLALRNIIGDVVDEATEYYEATDPLDYLEDWDNSFRKNHGPHASYGRFFDEESSSFLLNSSLTHETQSTLELDDTAYLKLLETTAILTMPDTGYVNYPESRRSRKGFTYNALFNRTASMLNSLAEQEPGLRTIREGILSTDPDALNNYIASTVRAHNAQNSLTKLIEMEPKDIIKEKSRILSLLSAGTQEESINGLDKLHMLEWNLLDGGYDNSPKRDTIRCFIDGQTQTDQQREKVTQTWEPQRVDFLIEIAEAAAREGRDPKMYISGRLNGGSGVYIAVELTHPRDDSKKIVFADNPMAGNALYIVDEVKLQNEGRADEWANVLGSNRKIARQKGAIRKYHTNDWMDIVPTILAMGDSTSVEIASRPVESDKRLDDLRRANDRLEAVIRAVNSLMSS